MRNCILFILCALVQPALAQSIDRQVIGSAGSAIENFSANLSFTVGEPVTLSSLSSVKLTQGFQQIDQSELVGVLELTTKTKLSVYPVPTRSILVVKTTFSGGEQMLRVDVLDAHGKQVLQTEVPAGGGAIDVSALSAAAYTLVLHDPDRDYHQRVRFVKY